MKPGGAFLGERNIGVDTKRLAILMRGGNAIPTGEGLTVGGSTWTYNGDMIIDATDDAQDTTLYIRNSEATYVANVEIDGDLTVAGSFTSGGIIPGGNILMADDEWIGLGSGAGRIVFDDQATDYISLMSANVGIGTATPAYELDVVSSLTTFSNVTTDTTNKNTRLAMYHYDTDEEPVGLIYAYSTATANEMRIGGGTSSCNAVTAISFRTAADTTTVTGSVVAFMNPDETQVLNRFRVTGTGTTPTSGVGVEVSFSGGVGYLVAYNRDTPGYEEMEYWAAEHVFRDGGTEILTVAAGGIVFNGANSITTSAGDLTVAPTSDLVLDPTGSDVVLYTDVDLSTYDWTSGTTGWGVTYDGKGDFRGLWVDELHTLAFIADVERALAGAEIICKSVSSLVVDFVAGTDTTITVYDIPGISGQVFAANDIVRIRRVSSGSIQEYWGTVTNYSDNLDGTQDWDIAWAYGTTPATYPAETPVLDYGSVAAPYGYVEISAIDSQAPWIQVADWDTNPWTGSNIDTHTRMGYLNGIAVAGDYWGLFAGTDVANTGKYVLATDNGVEIYNSNLVLHDGTNPTIELNPTTPYMAVGYPRPTSYLGGDGIWMGKDGSTEKMHIGTVSGGALTAGQSWDGSAMQIMGDLIVGPGIGFSVDYATFYFAFDGPEPYETDFHVNLNSHLGVQPTISGGELTGRAGKFGKGVQVAQACTNLLRDPLCTATTYWTPTAGSMSTLTPLGTMNKTAVRFTADTSSGNAYFQQATASMSLTSGVYYTASCRVKGPDGDAFTLYLRRSGTNLGTTVETANGEWQVFEVSGQVDITTTSDLRILIDPNPAANGQVWDVDWIQIEQSTYRTPLCAGSIYTPSTWAGTAHQSTSYRQGVTWNLDSWADQINTAQGTVAGWIGVDCLPSNKVGYMDVFATWGGDSNNRHLIRWMSDDRFDMYINGAYRVTNVGSGSLAYGDNVFFCYTWDFDNDEYYLYIGEGSTLYSGSSTTSLTVPTTTDISIGTSYDGSSSPINGVLDDVFILPRALSTSEVTAYFMSDAPLRVSGSNYELLLTEDGSGQVVGSSKGLYGYDDAGDECFALVTDDSVSWGGLTLNSGDMLIGDPANANMFWDQDVGKLQFRDTSTMQVEIGTDGKLYAGGGDVWLDSDGLKLLAGTGIGHSVNWYDTDDDRMVYMYATGNYDASEVHALWYAYSNGQNCQINMGAIRNGTGADFCDFKLYTYGPSGYNYSALLTTAAAAPDFIIHTDGGVMVSGSGSQANSIMTIGITINQGANDDEILAFKSSDIGHGITTLAETDTYFSATKAHASYGGVRFWSFAETGIDYGFVVQSTATDEDTTHTTGGLANIVEGAALKTGTTYGSHGTNANLWCVRNYTSTEFIVDAEGDYHYHGSDGGSYDEYEDVELVRVLSLATSKDLIRSRFDEFLRYNEDDLVRLGILGARRSEGGLINGAQVQRLLLGAVWQSHQRIEELESELGRIRAALPA